MQRGDYKVVLDACVLAPANLCDLLLKLAETPRLYTPLFSPEILTETVRTQTEKLNWPPDLSAYWRSEIEKHFPEAIVTGYEHYLAICENETKDRHVLAAAIQSRADSILTFNVKDFPAPSVLKFDITVSHPADYLVALYSIDSGLVVTRLNEIATRRNKSVEGVLASLKKSVSAFSEYVAEELGLDLA